ncbi:MAG: AMP-binding protein, partial [Dehalococcoidia bacterium]
MESPEPKSTEQPADKPWLRHYPSSVPHTLDYPDIPLYQLLADTASSHPERTALLFFGRQTSYEALFDEVKQVASGLLHLGLKKGDRVAIMLPNCPQLVAAYYGVLWAGGVVVMVNPLYTARELRVQFEDSEARFLIALDQVYQRAVEASSDTHLEKIIVTGIQERLPFPLNLLYRLKLRLKGQAVRVRKDDRTLRYSELLTHGSKSEATLSQPKEDLALLQYTGGTTGIPKGAMLTHFNLVANCTQIRAWLPAPVIEQATIMGALPFFHTYGMTIVMNYGIMIGARLILLPRFDLKAVLKAIQKYKPQLFPGVPTMYIAINNHPSVEKYDLKSVDLCISGAAPLPQEVKERFEALTGGHLVEGYGLTEASPVTHCNLLQGTQKPGSIGLPWVDT